MKDSKTIPLIITNRSTKYITVDSIRITNDNFTYVLGANQKFLSYDESQELNPSYSVYNCNETTSLYNLYPDKSKEILVTFKPVIKGITSGLLKIYYDTNQLLEIELNGEGYAAPLPIRIVNLDYKNFPNIQLNVSVDTFLSKYTNINSG